MTSETLKKLLVEELRDLYDAEKQLVKATAKMAKAAKNPELKQAFQYHNEQTRGQVERLEQMFEVLGKKARGKSCKGTKGLVEEGQQVMEEEFEDEAYDLAIIGAGQRVEHYEIAAYNSARSMAVQLGMKEVAGLLQESLTEENQTEKLLTQLSKTLLKQTGLSRPAEAGESTKTTSGAGAKKQASRTVSRQDNSAHFTTDHDEIRQWAEERGGKPAYIRGSGGMGDIGMLRLDFPGFSGKGSLEPIDWATWFRKFDDEKLALLYQNKTSHGDKSNFNRLVSREMASGAFRA
ncbi:MAG: ferritin-like domain-containing protein [Bryobacterales bacterium]|nr:ferritin-like domain-containing protein [Bryobacterales bacterium]MEB2362379.1 ferritin-like domain-containing protein [Bryobacterales bacterium]